MPPSSPKTIIEINQYEFRFYSSPCPLTLSYCYPLCDLIPLLCHVRSCNCSLVCLNRCHWRLLKSQEILLHWIRSRYKLILKNLLWKFNKNKKNFHCWGALLVPEFFGLYMLSGQGDVHIFFIFKVSLHFGILSCRQLTILKWWQTLFI